jgi:hypothetical protein
MLSRVQLFKGRPGLGPNDYSDPGPDKNRAKGPLPMRSNLRPSNQSLGRKASWRASTAK